MEKFMLNSNGGERTNMNDKQVLVKAPEWLKTVENDNVAGAIFGLIFGWTWDGTPKKVDNLKEYVAEKFSDLSEDEVAETCDLLIKHKVVA